MAQLLSDTLWTRVFQMLSEQLEVREACQLFQTVVDHPVFAWAKPRYDELDSHCWHLREGKRLSPKPPSASAMGPTSETDELGWIAWWHRQAQRNPALEFGLRAYQSSPKKEPEATSKSTSSQPSRIRRVPPMQSDSPTFPFLCEKACSSSFFFQYFHLKKYDDELFELEAVDKSCKTKFWTRLGRFPRCHVLWFRSCYGDVVDVLALCDDGIVEAFRGDSDSETEYRAQGRWTSVNLDPTGTLCDCGLPGSGCLKPLNLSLEIQFVRHSECPLKGRPGPWQSCEGWQRGQLSLEKAPGGLGIRSEVRVSGEALTAAGTPTARWLYCTEKSTGN